MVGVAVDAVGLLDLWAALGGRLARARVDVEARKVAGSDRHADAVSLVEDDAGGPAIDGRGHDLAGRERFGLLEGVAVTQPQHAVRQEVALAVGIHVAEADREVGVDRRGGHKQLGQHAAGRPPRAPAAVRW